MLPLREVLLWGNAIVSINRLSWPRVLCAQAHRLDNVLLLSSALVFGNDLLLGNALILMDFYLAQCFHSLMCSCGAMHF